VRITLRNALAIALITAIAAPAPGWGGEGGSAPGAAPAAPEAAAWEWGPLLGLSIWKLTATAYLFAPGQDDQFFVVAIGGSF
jgi:hypothetical protein